MTAPAKPLPCPFCGALLDHHSDGDGSWWQHPLSDDCVLDISLVISADEESDDIERWNRRAPQS